MLPPRLPAYGDRLFTGSPASHLNTAFLLMAQESDRAVTPIVCAVRDCLARLSVEKLIRIEASAKAAEGVHLNDLADDLDKRTSRMRRFSDQHLGHDRWDFTRDLPGQEADAAMAPRQPPPRLAVDVDAP